MSTYLGQSNLIYPSDSDDKILVVDTSGWEPIRRSLECGDMHASDIATFRQKSNFLLYTTKIIAKELTYEDKPNLFRVDASTIGNKQVSSTGVLTSGFDSQLEVQVQAISQDSVATAVNTPNGSSQNLGSYSGLSSADKSAVLLAEDLKKQQLQVAILTNDQMLKNYGNQFNILSYGSCSFLAGMVLQKLYTVQKGSALFYKWRRIDPQWVPKQQKFREVLNIEQQRFEAKTGFWL